MAGPTRRFSRTIVGVLALVAAFTVIVLLLVSHGDAASPAISAPSTTPVTSPRVTTTIGTVPPTTPETAPPTTTKPAPATTAKPTPATTPKPASTAPIPDAQVSAIWRSLTTGARKFYSSGDLKMLDSAVGAVKSKYSAYNANVLGGTFGDEITLTLVANGYSQCRIIDMSQALTQLVPGC